MRRLTIALLLLAAGSAFGQAWTPPAGKTSVMLSFQTSHIDSHALGSGRLVHDVDMRPRMLMLSVDHAVTDRLAAGFTTAYIESRFRGTAAPHPGILDDGRKHGTLQDLTIHARYAVLEGPVVVTPYVRATWPMRNYPTLGHSAGGRGLQEQEAGVAAGYEIPLLRGMWVSGSYGYTWVEKIDDHISVNRSSIEAQIGAVITPRVSVRLFGSGVKTHGGLSLPLSPHERAEHFHHHDQLMRADGTRAGAGLSYSITPAVDAHASFATSIRSKNTHAGRSIGIGASWNFDARRLLARLRSTSPVRAAAHQRNRDAIF